MKVKHWIGIGILATAAACGGGSSGGNSSNTTPTGPTTPANNNVAATISIVEYSFAPNTTSVKVGSTVQWVNNGTLPHTTVSDKNVWTSTQLGGGTADAYGGTSGGQSYNYTFNTAGTYSYHCALHPPATYPGFVGTIVVTP
jgi:plastocyanin